MIVIGAGPGDPDLLTSYAVELLGAAAMVIADAPLVELARAHAPQALVIEADGPAGGEGANEGPVVRLVVGDGLDVALGPGERLVPGVAADADRRAVARLADRGRQRPLEGLTVVVTRPRHQAASLSRRLRRLGASVVEFPTIRIAPPADDGAALRAALADLGRYEWLVVTSANGAEALLRGLPDARRAAGVHIAAIGPATAEVLAAARLPPDLVPPTFVAESLLEVFPLPVSASGTGRVVLARAAVARDVLPAGLAARGWSVDVVEAYRTVAAEPDPARLAEVAAADVLTFTSPSTFEQFRLLAGLPRPAQRVVCIGPVTAAAVRAAGVEVSLAASVHTVDGLVNELAASVAQT